MGGGGGGGGGGGDGGGGGGGQDGDMAPVEVEESESAVVTGEAVEEDPASALCSLLESAMEDLLGVEHFDRGAAQLLRVLDQLRGAEDSMPPALLRREVQQCLCGALECASRSLQGGTRRPPARAQPHCRIPPRAREPRSWPCGSQAERLARAPAVAPQSGAPHAGGDQGWPEHLRGAAVGTRLSQGGPAGAGRSDGRSSAAQNAVSWLVRQGTLKYSRNFLRVGTAPRKSCVI